MHDKVNSLLYTLDLDTTLDGLLPHAYIFMSLGINLVKGRRGVTSMVQRAKEGKRSLHQGARKKKEERRRRRKEERKEEEEETGGRGPAGPEAVQTGPQAGQAGPRTSQTGSQTGSTPATTGVVPTPNRKTFANFPVWRPVDLPWHQAVRPQAWLAPG
jgi:hypothetical protein